MMHGFGICRNNSSNLNNSHVKEIFSNSIIIELENSSFNHNYG